CARCDLDYREPTPALFSFNHPLGACPACKGFGRIIGIDYGLAIPDRSKTLAGGAVRPWQTGMSAECQADLMKFCRASGIPTDVPFRDLPAATQKWVIEGDPDYGIDEEHQWPRAWYGVKGYFRWLETKSYKMHVRVLLSRYRAYTPCPECQGRRLQPEALLYRLAVRADGSEAAGLTLADFYALPVERAFELARRLAAGRAKPTGDPVALALAEVQARLGYLVEVGLGYLTLDRPTRTLSGGETERVNLTTCLGSRLVNTLFVLDEPSVGLHPRDTDRLVSILRRLRDAGNTVVVVEHEASVMRAADQILDLGPGSGEKGGQLIFQGPLPELLRHPDSLTGQYLSGRKGIETPVRRPVSTRFDSSEGLVGSRVGELREAMPPYRAAPGGVARSFSSRGLQPCVLQVSGADRNNLRNLTVRIPLERFVCLTGVSGSGKTTLVREVLVPALRARLQTGAIVAKASDRLDAETASDCEEGPPDAGEPAPCRLTGWEALADVVLVDQSPLGKTPRSNPAVYVGAFEHLRDLFAQTDLARQRGYNSSAFSFNSGVGQCERCRGAGFEKIEMQFLSDVFVRCPDCNGRRYRAHILEVKLRAGGRALSIADLLETPVDDALDFLDRFLHLPAGRRAGAALGLLRDVGLGYLRLGQPINTLSGGESQRLKLVSHLAASAALRERGEGTAAAAAAEHGRGTLFLLDEPTTGLHFDDVRQLVAVLQRLVEAGHSLLVIEHNLDVIRCADWVIDLGPEAGEGGGRIVVEGTPEEVAACETSHTGRALRSALLPEGNGAVRSARRTPRAENA
ncbi:MAG TPA: excinuclease ABC subunit UvrA, partial [Methylomirabilota bacterium]|nr:excinuclease ABC subunit UvrA [Methylomirabilota bacterium]